jgi:D-sedoheptulose 7-phosphate isomerase
VAAAAFIEARRVLDELVRNPLHLDRVEAWAVLLHRQLAAGHKVMLCGNGGSSCDAAHFAEELTGRFRKDRPALAALACTDPGHITCTANDYGFDRVFERWVQALGQKGDVLIALSTSGNSENVRLAVEAARDKGMTTLGLLGGDGGKLRGRCEQEIVVPGATSDRIQELHMLILHVLVEGVERLAFPENYRPSSAG